MVMDQPVPLSQPASLDLSIIIVSFNTRQILLACLESVYARTRDLAFEVLVIDNNSADGSADAVKERFPSVGLIRNPENRGLSSAYNQGIKASRGRYLVFLNSDTILTENSFLKIVRYLDEHSEFGIGTPRIVDESNVVSSMRFRQDTPWDALRKILGKYDGDKEAREMGKEEAKEVEAIGGPSFFVRRTLLETIGLFDENYFLYNEEDDFCRRARRRGHKVLYYPETTLVHLRGKSTHLPQIREKVIIETYKSNLYFYAKYYSPAWNLVLRLAYRGAFILGMLKSAWRCLTGRPPRTADDSIALKWKLLFLKTPSARRK